MEHLGTASVYTEVWTANAVAAEGDSVFWVGQTVSARVDRYQTTGKTSIFILKNKGPSWDPSLFGLFPIHTCRDRRHHDC